MNSYERIAGMGVLLVAIMLLWQHSGLGEEAPKGRGEFEQRIALIAAATAVAEEFTCVRDSKHKDVEDKSWRTTLQEEMSKNVPSHTTSVASRGECERFLTEHVSTELTKRLTTICEERNVTLESVKARFVNFDRDFSTAVDARAQALNSRHFSGARQDAVGLQKQKINYNIPYPPRYEVDKCVDDSDTKKPALIETLLAEAIPSVRDVFEENVEHGRAQATTIANNAYAEYTDQKKKLLGLLDDSHIPVDCITQAAIKQIATDEIEKYAKRNDRNVPEHTEVFESLLKLADAMAAQLEDQRFASHLEKSLLTYREEDIKSNFLWGVGEKSAGTSRILG